MTLHSILKSKVAEWRDSNYKTEYPVISEILNFNYDSETQTLHFLRKAQFEALETYWYLRLVEGTPHIFDLYKRLYDDPVKLFKTLNITISQEELIKIMSKGGINSIFEKIKEDEDFVREHRLEALRETLILTYPSYILALAMGAGKTILIGTIIASEFAMALEYPDNINFVKNALVFAPGKTILGALKEISDIPYEKILPSRLYKQFLSTLKITYTRDGEKDIPIIKGSSFNVVVTNTEKIRIQKQAITKNLLQGILLNKEREDEIKEAVANQRLRTIASLPNLAIFSDEAHHTYGQAMEKDLKRVRQTVNYLADNTNVLVVVNTTGTPYFRRQILKDVVYWYGLSQGIKDGILKEVRENILAYEKISDKNFLEDIISDFLKNYKNLRIYDNSPAKLAIYFPQIKDLNSSKPIVEKSIIKYGLDPSVILPVHNASPEEIKDLFDNRINDSSLPYRVFLLVNKGTEGWNCPSLFATALARKLTASNNFVLQAASRCLRQTPGNKIKAKIYLSKDNVSILDSQLKETYGESLEELNRTPQDFVKERIVVRKVEIPPVVLKKKIRKVVPRDLKFKPEIKLQKPKINLEEIKKDILTPDESGGRKILVTVAQEKIKVEPDYIDIYSLVVELADNYRLPLMEIYTKLKEFYPEGEVLEQEAENIRKQIEEQIKNYQVIEEIVEQALALLKKEGFKEEKEGKKSIYVTEIMYHKDRAEKLLLKYEDFVKYHPQKQLSFGFHYSPYNFDSLPEKEFFKSILRKLNEDQVEDIYFTGAIDDPNKTDFFFEYKDKNGKWHNYSPDFLIRKKNGKMLIVEIKGEPFKDKQKEKEMRQVENLNPDRLKYEILETKRDELGFNEIEKVKKWIYK